MLKFINHHLDTIVGIGIYPLLSFLVFFVFFLGVLWWVATVRRSHIDHMAALPITPDNEVLKNHDNAH